jgi:hypothetical protein
VVRAKKADGDRSLTISLDLHYPNTDHERKRSLDLDLNIDGARQVVELRDVSCPSCKKNEESVEVNLAEDDRSLVVQTPPEHVRIREIGALVVALLFLALTVPDKTRPVAVPGLALVAAYYYGRNSSKKR